jgi:hypothetical protein
MESEWKWVWSCWSVGCNILRLPSPMAMVRSRVRKQTGTHNSVESVKVVTCSQFLPDRVYVYCSAGIFENGTLNGKNVEVSMNADRPSAHYGAKKRYFAFNGRKKGTLVFLASGLHDGHRCHKSKAQCGDVSNHLRLKQNQTLIYHACAASMRHLHTSFQLLSTS